MQETSDRPIEAFNKGPITVKAPWPKCLIPCPRDNPITNDRPEKGLDILLIKISYNGIFI